MGVARVEVDDFALVTHAVPAERVRVHLPDVYELQTFKAGGVERCFVSTTYFCNRDFRPAVVGFPRLTFAESTYRTYVVHRGRAGVYFFGRYVGSALVWAGQRAVARDTYHGDFVVDVVGDVDGFDLVACHIGSDAGETLLEVRARDEVTTRGAFTTPQEMAQFFTYRLHGYFTTTLRVQGHAPVSHPRMRPFEGELLQGRFELWERLGIVPREEAGAPFSVLVQPRVPFKILPARPLPL